MGGVWLYQGWTCCGGKLKKREQKEKLLVVRNPVLVKLAHWRKTEQIKGLCKKLWDKGLDGQRPRKSRDQLKGSFKKTKLLPKSTRKAQEITIS